MQRKNPMMWTGVLALPLAGLFAGISAGATGFADSEQVNKLLSETKSMAFQLKEDAATMESFTRMNVSAQSHASAINQIKDHIAALQRQTEKLQYARDQASPWQKAAIDKITPFLEELDGYTAAIVEHLNGVVRHNFAEYQDYLEANADYSADLAAMIGNYVDYGKTKDRLQHLAEKLELPATH